MSKKIQSEELGLTIKALRHKKGLTQQELAKQVGTSWEMISRYETGRTQIPLDRLSDIAQAFDLEVHEILSDMSSNTHDIAGAPLRQMNLIPFVQKPFVDFNDARRSTKTFYAAPNWIIQQYSQPVALDWSLVIFKSMFGKKFGRMLESSSGVLYVIDSEPTAGEPLADDPMMLIRKGKKLKLTFKSMLEKSEEVVGYAIATEVRFV